MRKQQLFMLRVGDAGGRPYQGHAQAPTRSEAVRHGFDDIPLLGGHVGEQVHASIKEKIRICHD